MVFVIKAFKPLNDPVHDCANGNADDQMLFCTGHNLISVVYVFDFEQSRTNHASAEGQSLGTFVMLVLP
jgi:hypothetical protein